MEPFIAQIMMFGGNFAPRGWALCDGQILPIASNSALFSILGTMYGGDGRTTFGLPDLRGRSPMHAGNGPGLSNRPLGQKDGAETVTLNQNQMPTHAHTVTLRGNSGGGDDADPNGRFPGNGDSIDLYADTGNVNMGAPNVATAGGGQAHTNIHPVQVVNFIIALQGTFPSRN